MIVTIEKSSNGGFIVETKTRGKFVFSYVHELYNWLESEFNPKELVPPPPVKDDDEIPF